MSTAAVHSSADSRMPVLAPSDVSFDSFLQQARDVYRQLEGALYELDQQHPSLVAVARTLAECVAKAAAIDEMGRSLNAHRDGAGRDRVQATLSHAIETVSSRLQSDALKPLLREQTKWVEAGFPEEIVVTDPDAVHFVVSTDLLYTVLMFKKASGVLDGEELTIRFAEGKAFLKVEGRYLPYEAFKERIVYSEAEKKFPGWNYIHPDGFIPKDNTDFDEMYPIARLKPEAYEQIARTAAQFWGEDQEEVDPGHEKRCIFQVMTTGRSCIPRTWWGINFDDMTPEHTSSRLITPDGYVYSFGTKMRAADGEKVTKLTNLLTTALSFTSALDYEEPKPSEEKRVTSIPITKERFDAIARYVNTHNKGFAFNFASQNCARFVNVQMALAGVPVDIKMSIPEFISNFFPTLANVPLVGRPLSSVIATISFVVTPIIDIISAILRCITPYPVKRVWEVLTWAAHELLRRIAAVLYNGFFFLVLGAGRTCLPPGRIPEHPVDPDDQLTMPTSNHLLHWWDIANPDAITGYHAYKVRMWQMKQRSSVFYTNPENGFSCIDPTKGWCPAAPCAV